MAFIFPFIHDDLSGSIAKTFIFINYGSVILAKCVQVNGYTVAFCSAEINFLYLFQFLIISDFFLCRIGAGEV